MVKVEKIKTPSAQFDLARDIRNEVFIIEQEVNEDEEFDEFEHSSTQFLAFINNEACGTCRYRTTDKGIKLERFAVKANFRLKGVGSSLVKACLAEIDLDKNIYLHAQLDAIPLYKSCGFKEYGELFYECDIAHYAMRYQP